jgi:hypothetical protein
MMILSEKYLKKLVRKGKAIERGIVSGPLDIRLMVVDRLDIQRTDHYEVSSK